MFNRSRLHVGDVAPAVTEADLHALFSQAGAIESLTMPRSANGAHKGFAFIEMKTPAEAQEAIRRFNGFYLHGHPLLVFSVPPRSPRRIDGNPQPE